jgi:hypothetical protein
MVQLHQIFLTCDAGGKRMTRRSNRTNNFSVLIPLVNSSHTIFFQTFKVKTTIFTTLPMNKS